MCWDEQKWPISTVIWVLGETHVKVQGYCAIPAPCGYKWLEMSRSLQCAMLCELLWYGGPTKILHHFGEFKHIKRSDNMIWWYNTKQTTSCKSYSLFLYLKWCLFFLHFARLSVVLFSGWQPDTTKRCQDVLGTFDDGHKDAFRRSCYSEMNLKNLKRGLTNHEILVHSQLFQLFHNNSE